MQLDILLRALQFSQAKADSQVGWGGGEAVSGARDLVLLLELSGAGGALCSPLTPAISATRHLTRSEPSHTDLALPLYPVPLTRLPRARLVGRRCGGLSSTWCPCCGGTRRCRTGWQTPWHGGRGWPSA